ncbi:hypothetical protein [Pontibacter harenae]|nr:hypothetical protein [Pontibacter harenae]
MMKFIRKEVLYALSLLWILCILVGCGKDGEEAVELETRIGLL